MALLITYTLVFASVLILVALGGCFSEHSGVINLGLEGIMVIGALGGALAMKFLPLLFYFYMFEPDDDSLFLAAVGVGAGFASYENVCYMVASGAESLSFLLIRGLAVGVMHIVSVYASVLGLVIARKLKAMRISSVIGALSLSMLFHGTYNLLVSAPGITSYIGFAVPILTAVAMLLAMKRYKKA